MLYGPGRLTRESGYCVEARCCLNVEPSVVLVQSLVLCGSWQVAHTCLYEQLFGKIHAPRFQDIQILSSLRWEL